MKYQFIDAYRSAFAVGKMCRALKVSQSGYYAWRVRPQSTRVRANETLDHHIKTIYRNSRGTYGSPRITKALHTQHIACSENRVARRMRINHIKAKTKKRFKVTTNSKHHHPVAENLLSQNFEAQRPNQVWTSDITYLWTHEGWLYLAVILDLFSRQIVGWAMSNSLGQELVASAFTQAIGRRRPPPGVIFHSDQGSQYAAWLHLEPLLDLNVIASMSDTGQPTQNGLVERFIRTLKEEHVDYTEYSDFNDAVRQLRYWLEVEYMTERIHSALDYATPTEFEALAYNSASLS